MACRGPIPAAAMRAVRPLGLRRSTLAPRCSSSFATRSCPPDTDRCSSPHPCTFSESTCPPFCSHSTTGCSSPRCAALTISWGSDVATQTGGLAACCRSSSAIAVWPSASATCSAVMPFCGRHQGGRPISILQVDARLVLKQQAHHGVLAHPRSRHESGDAYGVAQVDAGTALQQLLHHMQLPTSRGNVQQPAPVLV
eukprot:scaffold23492_cov65-Phaeocystis_antarctica.AAC.3